MDFSKDCSRVNLRIHYQAIGFGYDRILETMRQEAQSCRNKDELSLVERMILDPEGIDQIPPIALHNQLIARGRTMTSGGTGLGLAATSLFAQLNGGFLSLGNSALSQGAVVSMTFPIPQQGRMTPDRERNALVESLNVLAERVLAVNEVSEPVEEAVARVLHPIGLVYDEDQEALLAVYETAQINEIREQVGERLDDVADMSLEVCLEILRGMDMPPKIEPSTPAQVQLSA